VCSIPRQEARDAATCGFSERLVTAPVRCCPSFARRLRTQHGPRVIPAPPLLRRRLQRWVDPLGAAGGKGHSTPPVRRHDARSPLAQPILGESDIGHRLPELSCRAALRKQLAVSLPLPRSSCYRPAIRTRALASCQAAVVSSPQGAPSRWAPAAFGSLPQELP
jgi:hypothetical protein